MNQKKNYIKESFELLALKHPEIFLINNIESVPNQMKRDENNWKYVEINNVECELDALQQKYNVEFPEIFRYYISTYCHLIDSVVGPVELSFYDEPQISTISLISQLSDQPLMEIEDLLDQYERVSGMVSNGFIPFADLDDIGPLCIDCVTNKIFWFDHEEWYDFLSRDELEDNAVLAFESFEDFLAIIFRGEDITNE